MKYFSSSIIVSNANNEHAFNEQLQTREARVEEKKITLPIGNESNIILENDGGEIGRPVL